MPLPNRLANPVGVYRRSAMAEYRKTFACWCSFKELAGFVWTGFRG